ncbi:MAG: hypothetical protein ACE5H4_10315 [Candidatus Thorarchaeota archaeon]
MIAKALLFDLMGPKVLASSSYVKDVTTEGFLRSIVDRYSEVMSELLRRVVPVSIENKITYLSRVNEATLVVAVSDSTEVSGKDLETVDTIGQEMRRLIGRIPVRDAKSMFAKMVDERLTEEVYLCFLSESRPAPEDFSGQAVASFVETRGDGKEGFTGAVRIGPFDVHVMQMPPTSFAQNGWSDNLERAHVFALIVSTEGSESSLVGEVVKRIRDNSDAKILIVPSADNDLEKARELESAYFLDLCDSVSSRPSELVLSVLATAGFTDMHPELARDRWAIDDSIDRALESKDLEEESLGHQAFFVIDKMSGEPRFTYLYEDESKLFDMAPNLVAAISQFQIDSSSPTSTSVFQAGDLKYAIIELSDLVFTLVTGDREDVEVMRSRFSFLPDLYLDESPENTESSVDLYTSPPFTLKLLATLPPEDLPGRLAPFRVTPPEWSRFQSALVKDFLEAVWNSCDGMTTVSELSRGSGPEMVMGAIHLLKRMGAIDWKVRLVPADVPIAVGRLGEEIRSLYSHADNIFALIDGSRTISDISTQLGMESSVLLTVFAEMHKRGNVTFKDYNNMSPQS